MDFSGPAPPGSQASPPQNRESINFNHFTPYPPPPQFVAIGYGSPKQWTHQEWGVLNLPQVITTLSQEGEPLTSHDIIRLILLARLNSQTLGLGLKGPLGFPFPKYQALPEPRNKPCCPSVVWSHVIKSAEKAPTGCSVLNFPLSSRREASLTRPRVLSSFIGMRALLASRTRIAQFEFCFTVKPWSQRVTAVC